jgi:predicted secreted protein
MFQDKRSKKVIFVAHCILNQNTKLDMCAHYPGPIKETIQYLMDQGYGIIQLPCPELMYLGLARQTDEAAHPTVEQEDTRIARRMREDKARALFQQIADDILFQIEEYRQNGFEVAGLVGINGSPTCGVDTTWAEDEERKGYGVFVGLLHDMLESKGIQLKMTGIRAIDPDAAVEAVRGMVKR